jgi:hypothetical protein
MLVLVEVTRDDLVAVEDDPDTGHTGAAVASDSHEVGEGAGLD